MSYQVSSSSYQQTGASQAVYQQGGSSYQTSGYSLVSSNAAPVRTLIESSTIDNAQMSLVNNNQIVSQILTTTQGSPNRQQRTFVYRSESPIRNSSFGANVVNVATIKRADAPVYVSQSTTKNPIYVEKIVKVESSNTQELTILRQRISVLESNNKSLTEELVTLRNATPQQVEQIVYIQNDDEIAKLQDEHEGVKRSKRDAENANTRYLEEINRLNLQVREMSVKFTEYQSSLSLRENSLRVLQAQNEALLVRVVLTTAELERLVVNRVDVSPYQRKVSELESYLSIQERTIEELRVKLVSQEQIISSLRIYEVRAGQYDQEMNGLKIRIEELLRTVQTLQVTINSKDQELSRLSITINQLNVGSVQFQAVQQELESLKQSYSLKLKEIDELRFRTREFDMLVVRIKQLEVKLSESEQNSLLLIRKIEELSGNLNDENVKRSKREGDLQMSLREKQVVEEKLVHLTQQVEFLSMKITGYERQLQERDMVIVGLRQEISSFSVTIQQTQVYEVRIQEYERNLVVLRQRISELEGSAASENVKRSKREGDLQMTLREKQIVEEKLVQFSQQVEFLSQKIVGYERQLQERDLLVVSLRQEISSFSVTIQGQQQLELKLQEYERNITFLRQRIVELEGSITQENVKRSKREGDLQVYIREKQSYEEKIVSLSQQIEFFSRRVTIIETENASFRSAILATIAVLEEWAKIQVFHGQFTVSLEGLLVDLRKLSVSFSSSRVVTQQVVSSSSVGGGQYVSQSVSGGQYVSQQVSGGQYSSQQVSGGQYSSSSASGGQLVSGGQYVQVVQGGVQVSRSGNSQYVEASSQQSGGQYVTSSQSKQVVSYSSSSSN